MRAEGWLLLGVISKGLLFPSLANPALLGPPELGPDLVPQSRLLVQPEAVKSLMLEENIRCFVPVEPGFLNRIVEVTPG